MLGDRIRTARLAAGLSQTELARAVDGASRTVQSWELHEAVPKPETLRKVAEVTDRPLHWFYLNDGEEAA